MKKRSFLLKSVHFKKTVATPARTLFIRGLKSRVMKLPFLSLKMMVKSGLEIILKTRDFSPLIKRVIAGVS